MKWAGHVAQMGEKRTLRWVLVRKFEGVNLQDLDIVERIMLNWMLQVIGRRVVDWIDLAQNKEKRRAVVNTVMNTGVP